MIKVNLASKKQAVVAQGPQADGVKKPAFSFSLKSLDLNAIKDKISLDLVKDPQTRKLLLVVAVSALAYFALDSYEADLVQKQEDILTQVNAENAKLTADLAKTKGYEAIKLEIDADEKVLRTKLDTIKSLINDRQVPPKLLLALSNDIPSETWLSECVLSEKDLKLTGSSVGYTQITDFMKMLNESEYLTEVKLVNSRQEKDQTTGIDIANFELSAKRK
jgi:Tfp pilus assembly protein PilN